MSGNPSDRQVRRTTVDGRHELILDIERVLDLSTRQAVRAEFRFDPEAPWLVSVELAIKDGPRVLWRIGRDLLHQGLDSMSGLGSVQIWPSQSAGRATARLQLVSQDMAALFELPALPLAEWLTYTYELVPAGDELSEIDWDAESANLLRRPQAHRD
ncbi:SsgA family sporulation/cell division regulator [Streptomyces sp. NPDC005483]|uniref:SsgA family sporulation/cell division regulator n=1 Tax=Streptomyces sp. NPDC005483 TaxID=3154882 RepID=UPI0033B650C1